MRHLAIALGFTLVALSLSDTYTVIHRRPSSILATLLGGKPNSVRIYDIKGGSSLIPEGVSLHANDAASTIQIDGPKAQATEVKAILQQFDVAVKMIRLHIVVRSKADKYESATDTQIANNSQWSIDDDVSGLKLAIAPRINDDGTVTAVLGLANSSSHSDIVMRMPQKRTSTLTLGAPGILLVDNRSVPVRKTPMIPEGVELSIRFEIEESH